MFFSARDCRAGGVDGWTQPNLSRSRGPGEQWHERRAVVLDGHKAKKLKAGGAGIRDGMDDVDQAKRMTDHLDG